MNATKIFLNSFVQGAKNKPVFLLLFVFFFYSVLFVPGFRNTHNIYNLALQSTHLIIVCLGYMFVMLNGSIDFSVTSTISITSIVGAWVMTNNDGLLAGSPYASLAAISIMLLIGLIVGIINGVSVVFLKIPSFMATMAVNLVFGGYALFFSRSLSIGNLPASFLAISRGTFLFLPITVWLTIAVVLITYYLLHCSKFGRHVFSTGMNPTAAHISGIPVKKTIFLVFIISSLIAVIGSIVMTADTGAGMPTMAARRLLDIIAAVVIGGTSIFGGKGNVWGVIAGAMLITLLNNSLNMLGTEWFVINVIKGLIILSVSFLDARNIKR